MNRVYSDDGAGYGRLSASGLPQLARRGACSAGACHRDYAASAWRLHSARPRLSAAFAEYQASGRAAVTEDGARMAHSRRASFDRHNPGPPAHVRSPGGPSSI